MKQLLLILLLVTTTAGCMEIENGQVVLTKPPKPESPVVNLPVEMRIRNWTDRSGAGSCVHASTAMLLKWLGEVELAKKWQKTYAGGETAISILKYWSAAGIPYCSTLNARTYECSGDPAFLRWASNTRRGAIIWWKPSHCCLFVGIEKINGREYAIILDNNTPNKYDEPVPLEEFITLWRRCGGFAATPVLTPTGPLPWPIIRPLREEA
jgi:hypothetical protein